MVGVHSVDVDKPAAIGVTDVLRHGEREGEATVPNAVRSGKESLCPVVILQRRASSRFTSIVQLAGYEFPLISHRGRYHTIKAFSVFDMAAHSGYTPSLQLRSFRNAVDIVYDYFHRGKV